PERARVRFELFDVLGRRVWAQAEKFFQAGFHEETWDGKDELGKLAASGRYFLRMVAENAARQEIVREVQLSLIR
ncbi:hypothetical protein HUU05_28760, partial [candidate division KSB1 bacterium]|nr:hypothetical protein [candidate division KSB1 bacterium]